MRKVRFPALLALVTIATIVIGSAPASASAAKISAACTKVGAKSGSLICTEVNGKLHWVTAKKAQKISYSAATQASIDDKSISFTTQSSAKLVVASRSLTPKICTISPSVIKIVGTPGRCTIQLSQTGNASFLPAGVVKLEIVVKGINVIDFQLPGALLLSQNTFQLAATGSSSASIVFAVQTPQICTVTERILLLKGIGRCIVTANQAGDAFLPDAKEVSRSVEISTDRVSADLPDTVSGFQIKAIYVVPSDGTDHSYDINGVISSVLDDGEAYLRDQLGLEIPIDSKSSGYDIGFLKSSKSSQYFLSTAGSYAELLRESQVMDAPGTNRKNYIFFVDTDTIISPGYCGEAPRPGIVAIVAIGLAECGKQTNYFSNYASQTWVHEIFHNFGVSHVPDLCDIMTSGQIVDGPLCPAGQLHTIDAKRNMYVGKDTYGTDISRLRVWKGSTDNKSLIADCLVTPTNQAGSDGLNFSYCPTGAQTIGPAAYCWTNVTSVSLEQLVNGAWVPVGVGTSKSLPWGERVDWRCGSAGSTAPSIGIIVDTPGVIRYRWLVNGNVAEEMKIIWVA